jgi:hypothetical protein
MWRNLSFLWHVMIISYLRLCVFEGYSPKYKKNSPILLPIYYNNTKSRISNYRGPTTSFSTQYDCVMKKINTYRCKAGVCTTAQGDMILNLHEQSFVLTRFVMYTGLS